MWLWGALRLAGFIILALMLLACLVQPAWSELSSGVGTSLAADEHASTRSGAIHEREAIPLAAPSDVRAENEEKVEEGEVDAIEEQSEEDEEEEEDDDEDDYDDYDDYDTGDEDEDAGPCGDPDRVLQDHLQRLQQARTNGRDEL
ncbi:uncharacterized protein MONBRDRAFT_11512 [Monosiga brevicollis MX1]|uniref:Uncharacterized protein n=1 Tax=Monosiga brevicollis TaxID=81824 RepID=A9V9D3_MONBE|nr:uncharacterized protein MONBRDRAFT_11512 [Monosiga brevicollis MX1]EDQ85841.1 predicted protein [Monosiga brevicollis MX1]|eukprot:XP_001749320.1 hypothetical protein [Monosiga brevicollis MX1]